MDEKTAKKIDEISALGEQAAGQAWDSRGLIENDDLRQ